ncbi:hypothetical protein SHK19_03920 [Nocardioides bizhenqiangii]|uniref:Outer membrane lipoprotein-sorting protein n=1 Tax=Nocardioides bizhenqiangii TaxID=3095076 RepID=A0ABZ0ZU23_9ACTN|nr:hypothetical protein [Nocardioides sp. HM61]WQQ27379.1 hypothetical protein SHK19_03920 [Nocardioides sp. HM61]
MTAQTFAASLTEAMYGAGTVHMLMTSEGKSIAEVDYRFSATGDPAMHGTAESDEGTVEMMLVDGAFYVREEAERSWMQLPPELADQILAGTQAGDPTQLIEVFESGLDEVTYLGSEDIDGEELYGYDVSFSAEYLAREMDVPTNEVPAISYELYLDGAHLLRKMTISAAGVEGVVRLSDWGEPVEIETPPADQVEPFELPSG